MRESSINLVEFYFVATISLTSFRPHKTHSSRRTLRDSVNSIKSRKIRAPQCMGYAHELFIVIICGSPDSAFYSIFVADEHRRKIGTMTTTTTTEACGMSSRATKQHASAIIIINIISIATQQSTIKVVVVANRGQSPPPSLIWAEREPHKMRNTGL